MSSKWIMRFSEKKRKSTKTIKLSWIVGQCMGDYKRRLITKVVNTNIKGNAISQNLPDDKQMMRN